MSSKVVKIQELSEDQRLPLLRTHAALIPPPCPVLGVKHAARLPAEERSSSTLACLFVVALFFCGAVQCAVGCCLLVTEHATRIVARPWGRHAHSCGWCAVRPRHN